MTTSMREIPLTGGPVEFRGALELETTGAGVLPLRLPAWTRTQYPDAFTRVWPTCPPASAWCSVPGRVPWSSTC
ncbi:hypothetical protein [Streptomyces eurocidicus]|uniref:hypothetical protein n=1 Tax=Streptomyces eurocidicus TaxID=66423 RepID=UPI0026AFCD52